MTTYPKVRCNLGSYDFCHPSEKQMCYSFTLPDDAPATLIKAGSTDKDGPVTSDPIVAASLLVEHGKACLYCGHLDRWRELLQWLEEHEDEHEDTRLLDRRERLVEELEEIEKRLTTRGVEFRQEVGAP